MHRRVSRQIRNLDEAKETANLIIEQKMDAMILRMCQNPLYKAWNKEYWVDIVIFGKQTSKTEALYQKFLDSQL